jgi:2-haloacid dehalogenase
MAKTRAPLKALVFDVFGTVVDWRTSIIADLEAFGAERGIKGDWTRLADEWRAGYHPAMDRVRKGALPWTKLDDLHRMTLDRLLSELGISGLTEGDKDHVNRVWHRLQPWPDARAGLERLRRKYLIGTLSNGNVSLLASMAKNVGLPWDVILSGELVHHFKPDDEVYRLALETLGPEPGSVMLVAAHNGDLLAAAKNGLATGFVARPTEYGPRQSKDFKAEHDFDVVARDFEDLATKLGA